MTNEAQGAPPRPLILIRGFGGVGVDDERANPYQGFNDGTVYPGRRGENYIYEGFVLRAMKSDEHPYRDATNVAGFYGADQGAPPDLGDLGEDDVTGTIVLDPAVERKVLSHGTAGTIWIFRYYDLDPRSLRVYGKGLERLVTLIRRSAARHGETFRGVDIVAHSMGGLVTREGVIAMHQTATAPDAADDVLPPRELVHRIVTLGTPHRGIAFQRTPEWLLKVLPKVESASNELASFDPESTRFLEWDDVYDVRNVLTVVGTNYRSYNIGIASALNRLSSLLNDGSMVYNRSDGLVKQASAQLPGAPRTFVHKCHGGNDSLVTSREAYEIAMRFFHGTHRVSLFLDEGRITRGRDLIGRSEFYFGVSIKPRYVDFDLFHQSIEAENCYGPFNEMDLSDDLGDLQRRLRLPLAEFGGATDWAGPDRLIWEGWIDRDATPDPRFGIVFRVDFYVGERDSYGVGFSDNVVYRKQYYVQTFPRDAAGNGTAIFLHTGEQVLVGEHALDRAGVQAVADDPARTDVVQAAPVDGSPGDWTFPITGTGFEGTFRVRIQEDRG
ncbi:esterase/lipase family protein [Agromyces sp. SYSU T00194]|uniref:esterase/lipase family protein n=1 Tax=Agromyces chitinivorans TaxID=3158560 RepID=UPI0033958F9C